VALNTITLQFSGFIEWNIHIKAVLTGHLYWNKEKVAGLTELLTTSTL
jgi:hypothetical protein